MGVSEMMVSRQIDPVEPRVRPNDPVFGAALPGIVLGLEDDEALGVSHARSQSTRGDQAEKQCRNQELHHVFPLVARHAVSAGANEAGGRMSEANPGEACLALRDPGYRSAGYILRNRLSTGAANDAIISVVARRRPTNMIPAVAALMWASLPFPTSP